MIPLARLWRLWCHNQHQLLVFAVDLTIQELGHVVDSLGRVQLWVEIVVVVADSSHGDPVLAVDGKLQEADGEDVRHVEDEPHDVVESQPRHVSGKIRTFTMYTVLFKKRLKDL